MELLLVSQSYQAPGAGIISPSVPKFHSLGGVVSNINNFRWGSPKISQALGLIPCTRQPGHGAVVNFANPGARGDRGMAMPHHVTQSTAKTSVGTQPLTHGCLPRTLGSPNQEWKKISPTALEPGCADDCRFRNHDGVALLLVVEGLTWYLDLLNPYPVKFCVCALGLGSIRCLPSQRGFYRVISTFSGEYKKVQAHPKEHFS